jgi:hypothetical protein
MYIILVIILLLITLVLFLKTPKEKRKLNYAFKENEKWLENELKLYPKEAEAVIIKGQKKKAFLYILPLLLLSLPAIILNTYIKHSIHDPIECHQIFNTNLLIFNYKVTFISMFIFTQLGAFYLAYEGYKSKYNPPLDSVRFQDFISKKIKNYKIIGIIQISMPLLVLLLNFYVYNSLNKLCDEDCKTKFDKRIIKECKSDIHYVK